LFWFFFFLSSAPSAFFFVLLSVLLSPFPYHHHPFDSSLFQFFLVRSDPIFSSFIYFVCKN